MADDVTLPGDGAVVATDEVSSRHYQWMKPAFGADGTATAVSATNPLPVGDQSTILTGSLATTGTLIGPVDATSYSYMMVAMTGTFSATVAVQGSSDNSTWATISRSGPVSNGNMGTAPVFSSANMTTGNLYWSPTYFPYLRVQVTAYTSGTVGATAWLCRGTPPAVNVTGASASSLTVIGSNSGGSDGVSTALAGLLTQAEAYAFNGSTWDRVRTFGTQGAIGVTPVAGTSGGWSVSSQTALTNTDVAVKASAGQFGGYMIYNPNASAAYVQVFDAATASVTVGTTTPTYVLAIPAGAAANLELTCGVAHSTAITVAATTTATGSTAPTTALTAVFFFK